MNKPKILVVGSLVMDNIVSTEVFPNSGQSIIGTVFRKAPGGKGANQAVQAARLGADVTMFGKAGKDNDGDVLLDTCKASGVDVSPVIRDGATHTGCAAVLLEEKPGESTKNRIIIVPNGPLSTGIINNYSREKTRRIDLSYSISYGDDYELAKSVLLDIIGKDERIAKTPAPFVELGSLGASSIDITVRVWCNAADYWAIYFDMNKTVYKTFPEKGLNFPFNTMTVEVKKD